MSTTTQAAALDAAALAVLCERALRHRLGPRRLEDVDPSTFVLAEHSSEGLGRRVEFTIRTRGIEVTQGYGEDRKTLASLSVADVVALVLDFRAQDPGAAHQRDIAAAEALIASRRSGFENAWRHLRDPSHPHYAAVQRSLARDDIHSQFTTAGHTLADRDLYSRLLAIATAALAALRAAGPHQPPQGRLF